MRITPTEGVTTVALLGLSAFQAALAAGAPWGKAAYGGTHPGRLPTRLRVVSGVAAPTYAVGALLVAGRHGSPRARRRALTGLAGYLGVGVLANAASRSPVERAIWTPVTAAAAVAAWHSRPPAPAG